MKEFLDYLKSKEFLSSSLFYPASGTDGQPIKLLGKNYNHFVYVDYGTSEEFFLEELNSGFNGYNPSITKIEFETFFHLSTGEDWLMEITPQHSGKRLNSNANPFVYFVELTRDQNLDDNHGPEKIELLFCGAEAVFVFKRLYVDNKTQPAAIAVIQQGFGFGGGWTRFDNPESEFGRLVDWKNVHLIDKDKLKLRI